MKVIKILIIAALLFSTPAFATVYFVTQTAAGDGTGSSMANAAALSYFEAGTGVFAALDGDTVCFSGAIQAAGDGDIDIPDADGTAGNYVILDGSGEGVCAAASQATITVVDEEHGFHDNNPNYLKIRGFEFRNSSGDDGIAIWFYCSTGVCTEVYIEDNDIQLYGEVGAYLTKGIATDGPFSYLYVTGNNIVGLDWDAYDGIWLTQQGYNGTASNYYVYNNTLSGWAHGGIAVSLLDSGGAGTVENIQIYDNTLSGGDRAYTRGISVIVLDSVGYTIGDIDKVYVHDNVEYDQRAPDQISGQNVAIYRNKIYNVRNVCGATAESYWGDSECTEECIFDWCSETTGRWGSSGAGYRGTGQALVMHLDALDNQAVFQNTYYNISESSLQVRGGGTVSNLKIVGNIFAEDNVRSIGSNGFTYRSANQDCLGENDPYDCCTAGVGQGSCAAHYSYVNDVSDSDPPGSFFSGADCSVWVDNFTMLAAAEIKNNIWYTVGQADVFCHSEGGGEMYTVAEAQASSGTGGGDWAAGELTILLNETPNADPLFTNAVGANFIPLAGSPAIDRGFWTLVDGASSGDKVFNVDNALFLGAPGETIKTAAGATGVIDSIDYATNEITTLENITVLDDEGIGLDYKGLSLDAGAIEYEFISPPAPAPTPLGSGTGGTLGFGAGR